LAAWPTSVWMRMYAVTTGPDLLAHAAALQRLVLKGWWHAAAGSGDCVGDTMESPEVRSTRSRRVPGFEPGQPVPRRTDVSSVVRLTCILATDVCWDVQVYAHRL
jgi:hypothetical protein